MAHELYQIDGKWSMAFAGDTPWHGLGRNLSPDAPLEVWMKEAMLNWEVNRTEVQYTLDNAKVKNLGVDAIHDVKVNGPLFQFPTRHVIYRSDNGQPLSVVSDRYKIVQPETIINFYRRLIEKHGFKMETAGSLKGGQRVWALASTGLGASLLGQDRIGRYLLLATSYDGSLSTVASFTTVRVVCNNTLTMAYNALRSKGFTDMVRVPHMTEFDPDQVHIELGLADEAFETFMDHASALATRKIKAADAVEYFMKLLGVVDKDGNVVEDSVPERTMNSLYQVYKGGVGQDTKSAKDTAWGLVNAVSRFVDHDKSTQSQDNRLNSAWFGNGGRMKNSAMDLALDMFTDYKKAA